jgi:hypothetical protein
MMPSLYLLFNHELTSLQKRDALHGLGVEEIYNPPPDLKAVWEQVPADLEKIGSYLEPIKLGLRSHAEKQDYVLIQGDFGACYIMVRFAMGHGLIPIYSTTEREAVEEHGEDGSVKITHRFRHRIFRRYGR